MTDHEHGDLSKLTGILLLGFLLPQSTGNDFFLLHNISHKREQHQSTGAQTSEYMSEMEDVGDYIIHMSLEERLESSCHRYTPDEYGEFHTISFEPLEFVFQSFLNNALKQFLRGRPCHTKEVELLHILAMAIHPQPSEQSIRETSSTLDQNNSVPWQTAKRFMASLVPHSFHVNYHHRVQLVDLVANYLVIPEFHTEMASSDYALLTEGALPHLRASLYAFGMAASSPYDSHIAQCGMVALATQNGMDYVVKEEWVRLLHRMVDDRTNYPVGQPMLDASNLDSSNSKKASIQTLSSTSMHSLTQRTLGDSCFCPHRARGELLRGFLARYCEARHFADEEFLQYALSSLTDAIEMQVDCWTRDGDEEETIQEEDEMRKDECKTTSQPPSVLASLLYAAKNLFYFLLPMKKKDMSDQDRIESGEAETEPDEGHRRDMLVSCGIQLVHHWDPNIAEEACNLILLAFSYADEMWEDYVGAVFESIKVAIDILVDRNNSDESMSIRVPIEGMVSAFSQRSVTFAANLFQLLFKKQMSLKGKRSNAHIFRLIAAVANACPAVAQKHRAILMRDLTHLEDTTSKTHILAIILACRKARYFISEEDAESLSLSSLGGWEKYLVARQALLTGNYQFAKVIYDQLINVTSSEQNVMWLSALRQIAEGESALAHVGAHGLPDATTSLRSAMITLRFLSKSNGNQRDFSVAFQIKWLSLRVSFLDLLTGIRQLTREMRLTGTGPKKLTRPHLHLKNLIKGVNRLGYQYDRLSRQFGIFSSQQTRSSLRTLRVLCAFVADAARQVFAESLPESVPSHQSQRSPQGDASQPLTSLMNQLQAIALKEMDTSVDAKIRAAAMLEILDGLLKVSIPIPRDLTTTKSVPPARAKVTWDPDEYCDDALHDNPDLMTISSNSSMSFVASGLIPEAMLAQTRIPFSIILIWLTIELKGIPIKSNPSSADTQDEIGSLVTMDPIQLRDLNPIATTMSSSGTFFSKVRIASPIEEGRYDISFQLGCRDIRGGEWDLPFAQDPRRFSVKIVRSIL
jgi:integrator complex subunit 7